MDASIIVILGMLLLISICSNVKFYLSLKKFRKKEKNRTQRIDQEGAPVFATVTRVIHQKRHTNYVVYAQWLSRETRKIYYFHEEYRFLRGALNFRPKIQKGDIVQVNVIFDEFLYRIKRKK